LSDIINGESNSVTLPASSQGFDALTALEVENITGGYEDAPFVAEMTPEQAERNLNLLDTQIAKFGDDFKPDIEAITGNGGGVMDFALGLNPGGGMPSVAKVDTKVGSTISEDNTHTVKDGFDSNSQTAFDKIFTPENDSESIRYLNAATETSSSLKDIAYDLTRQLYGHQDQKNNNDFNSTTAASARLSGNISKQSVAKAGDELTSNDEVKLKDTPESGNSKNSGKLGELAKKIPGEVSLGAELSHTGSWSEGESSSVSNDVNQTRIAQYLAAYAYAEDKNDALVELREQMTTLVEDDRRVAAEAEKDHQVDFIQEQNDDRNILERSLDWGAEFADDTVDFIVGKDVER
jgi:hypothetical protein